MNLKKILIITSIILLLSLTAVSAADLNDVNGTNTIDYDTHLISTLENTNVENSNATSSTGTFDDLQREINNAPTGTVLTLTRDYNGHCGGKIELNKDFTINGQGHTIDCLGAGNCIAFHSNSGIIYLKNLKIINGCNNNYDIGGCIQIEGSAKYYLENCIFNDNWADNNGGAICNAAKKALTIINCEFNHNQAHADHGGAIYSVGDVYIQGSTFKFNEANFYGGAIYSEKEIHIENNQCR